MALPVFLDCDPGHDDMMAIMLAIANPAVELLGISTVAGNQTGDRTWLNAARVLTLLGAEDVPLYRGADAPLCRPLVTAGEIHGTSGLDGAPLPEPAPVFAAAAAAYERGEAKPGAVALAETIMRHSEPVTLIPTGPLTNVALALRLWPALRNHIRQIVLMGGGVQDSNITPVAEFNIYVDPEAAAAVFAAGIPLRMVTVDVTNRAIMDFPRIASLAEGGSVSRVVAGLMEFFARANEQAFGIPGAPIHDALTVATVINPSLVETRECNVVVETRGEHSRGCTVVDRYGVTRREANAHVTFDVDCEGFMALMMDAVAACDARGAGGTVQNRHLNQERNTAV